jgi:PST family polysaccharide transporter
MRNRGNTTAGGLGASASRGAASTMVGQLLRAVLQLASIVILARLLSPADYGLLAMVTVVIGIGELFRDFGLSSAAIQAKTLNRGQRDNLFWINSAIGLILCLVAFYSAGLVATLFDDARLVPLTQLLSLTFLFNGLSTQFRADLTRNLSFNKLAVLDVSAMFVGLGVGVVMAVLGYGYWSLAWMQLAQGVTALLLSVVFCRWLPGWIHRDAEMRGFLRFGTGLLGSQILGYVAKNLHTVLIGANLGAVALGLYSRAFQLMNFPLNQLQAPSSRVALPVLSRLHDDKPRYDAFLLQGQSIMLHVVAIVLALSTAQAVPLFSLILGNQWLAAAPIFQILAVAGFATMVNYACYWVFLSKGLTGSHFKLSLISRPILIVIIAVGAVWGLYGVAIAYSAGSLLMWPITLYWLSRVSDAPVRQMFGNGLRTILAYGFGTLISFASANLVVADQLVLRLLVGSAGLAAALALMYVAWPRFRRDVTLILQMRRFFGRTSKA